MCRSHQEATFVTIYCILVYHNYLPHMQLVIICRELESHLHLDNFSKLSDVIFLSSKFYKIIHPEG